MPFTSQEIFLFIVMVPLLIFVGKKLRGEKPKKLTDTPEKGVERFSSELTQKIEIGYYRDAETVLLVAFDSDVEANIVRSLLLEHSIYAEIRDQFMGATRFNYSYAVGGVKIFVDRRELAEARQLLSLHEQIADSDAPEWQPRVCPSCGSDMITFQKFHPASLLLLVSIPFLPVRANRWLCLKCNHKWKEQ
jgi:hypothetical protein